WAPHHVAPAGDEENTVGGLRRELREIAREIGRRADETAGRTGRVRLEVAADRQTPSKQHAAGMTARKRHATRQRHVGGRFFQARGSHDLALDPGPIWLAGPGFHYPAPKAGSP